MVVAGGDIGYQRSQGVEGRFVAVLQLLIHVLFHQVHGHMARAFDHHLHIVLPGDMGQLAEGLEFCHLRFVVGIRH